MLSDADLRQAKHLELKTRVDEAFDSSRVDAMATFGSVDALCTRFLNAREYDVSEAFTMLSKTLEWRQREAIDTVLTRHVLSRAQNEAIRMNHPQGFHKTDRLGHPVWIERPGYMNVDGMTAVVSVDDILWHHIQSQEYFHRVMLPECRRRQHLVAASTACSSSSSPVNDEDDDASLLLAPRLTVIHDLSNVGRHNIRPIVLKVIQAIATLDQEHYPDTLHQLFIVNVPLIFYGPWKMIQLFLNEVTKKKINLLGRSADLSQLYEVVDPCHLPTFLGGTCVCQSGTLHGGCVSSTDCVDTAFFTELDAYVASQIASTLTTKGDMAATSTYVEQPSVRLVALDTSSSSS